MNEARAPTNEEIRTQVKADYLNGIKPKELSEKTGIPVNTIKSWIKRGKWKNPEPVKDAPSKKEGASPKRKRGAPKGNKNAEGAGAPEGNKNALKHGGYAAVYWDTLDEEELDILNDTPADEESLLLEQITLFSIRERRIMRAIAKYRDAKGGMYVEGISRYETKRSFKEGEEDQYNSLVAKKIKKGDRMPGQSYELTTNTGSTADLISRLERELTSVQSKKTKAIETLGKLRLEKQKLDGESKGNEVVRAWAENVMKARNAK